MAKQSALDQILDRINQAAKSIGGSANIFSPVTLGAKAAKDSGAVEAIRAAFIKPVGNELKKNSVVSAYLRQVAANKQNPFFNDNGNNPVQWLGKVAEDYKKRGPFEAAQDLTYPILENPYVEPIEEPIVSNIRVANLKAGRPSDLVNNLLGQTDEQIAPQAQAEYPRKTPASILGHTADTIAVELKRYLETGKIVPERKPKGGIDEQQDSLIPEGLKVLLPNSNDSYYNNIFQPAKNVVNFSPLFNDNNSLSGTGEF
jgi:hypothetical protein